MNNSIKRIASLLLIVALPLSSTVSAWAETTQNTSNLCHDAGTSFIFFNGVNTTAVEARIATLNFKVIHGVTSPSGDKIKYEYLYNYTNGFEDFVEVFEQRLKEQEKKLGLSESALSNRFELFLNGNGSWWSNLTNTISSLLEFQKDFIDLKKAEVVNSLIASRANPPTMTNYVEHRSRLDNLILEGKKLLFVAHSQGNLFANAAYDYARTKVSADSVKVIHIAPASPITHGKHVLVNLDLVINGLRATGTVPDITHDIPPIDSRPVGLNLVPEFPPFGHGLLEIYLNPHFQVSKDIKKYIDEALTELIAPPAQATSGFFSANLTWNGNGDVDLHTFEPSGFHVFYQNMTGNSGYLDVDNTEANGPEHYYASCDATKLRTGTYSIKVANYERAQGRTATVQIASWNEGVLGTKSVILGAETGDNPSDTLFNVVVTKDEQTGKYRVSLANS